ncbi:MAG: hypothetical protein JST84_22035 [Acidobacteria bacterium]|nr:hypothetical protein [Acidobacteriota bacterium]
MLKRYLSFFLIVVLLQASSAIPAFAKSKAEKDAAHAAKVKAGIVKLGVGKQARVSLKLRDKTKLSGYISEVRDDAFVVADLNTGNTTTVAYPNVTQVRGNNLSTGVKIAIWAGVAVAIIVTLYLVRGAFCDGCD